MANGTPISTQQKLKLLYKQLLTGIAIFAMIVAVAPPPTANAAQLTARKATLSSSAPNTVAAGTGVTYTFNFTPAVTTPIKSMNIDFCDSASGTCVPPANIPSGLVTTGAAISGTPTGLGTGGSWSGTFSTNGRIRIANASSAGTAGAATVAFSGITNPTAANASFYMRITTYSDAAFSTPIDTGTVAASTANQITVSGSVDETLTFCTGTSGITTSSCAGATGTSVSLGSLTPSTTGSGTSQMGAATNAGSGYVITVAGTTLMSGSNTVTALASPTTSTQGSEQFGMNLVANTTPSVGQAPDGAGSATPASGYGTANSFKFVTGDTVASNATSDNFRRFTVSYMANVGNTTEPGTYQTALTYVCTATF